MEHSYLSNTDGNAVPRDVKHLLIAIVMLNLLVAVISMLQGDVAGLSGVAVWTVAIYILFGYFRRRKPWARTALAMLTFPIGLVLFSRRFKTYLALQEE